MGSVELTRVRRIGRDDASMRVTPKRARKGAEVASKNISWPVVPPFEATIGRAVVLV